MSKTFDLLNMRPSGIPNMEGLFGKAHSHNWDIDRDVDWSRGIQPDDPVMGPRWAPYSLTPTFRKLPLRARNHFTRRSFSFTLNSLRLGEAVAEEVCFRVGLKSRHPDQKSHAAAQAMDEARHYTAYSRILEMLNEQPEEIEKHTRTTFDTVLALDSVHDLIAWEMFYLESLATNVLRLIGQHARHPVVKRVFRLSTRDESRHMGFGILYVQDWLGRCNFDEQVEFAGTWLNQILTLSFGQQDPTSLNRTTRWLYEADVANSLELATAMLREQQVVLQRDFEDAAAGTRVPQELKSARRAGLLRPDLLEALRLQAHPLVRGALAASEKDD
ncbi:MAG: ferritin-like domain-containing protein [Deltaproteobacteria bacterium]|nr:ferritin-like domain-containing protein [Deltaproteobacteria bacterium]